MTRRADRLVGALIVGLLASTPIALASERLHVASRGESFESVARLYYDREGLAAVVASHNGLVDQALEEGSELRIPVPELHVVAPGETWSSLAERSLGNPALAGELATLNDRQRDGPLEPGQRIVLPALATYRIQPGDFLRSLARRFYGSAERAALLARVNGVEDPRRLFVGRVMKIPIVVGSSDSTLDAEATGDAIGTAPGANPELDAELRAAIGAYLDGRYQTALESLEALRSRALADGTPQEQRLLLRHLAFVYVAWDRSADACGAVRDLRAVDPRPEWDPVLVSPKIRRVIDSCDDR